MAGERGGESETWHMWQRRERGESERHGTCTQPRRERREGKREEERRRLLVDCCPGVVVSASCRLDLGCSVSVVC